MEVIGCHIKIGITARLLVLTIERTGIHVFGADKVFVLAESIGAVCMAICVGTNTNRTITIICICMEDSQGEEYCAGDELEGRHDGDLTAMLKR